MKIILAPDTFKGTMSSQKVIEVMKKRLNSLQDVEIIEIPIADGGEGTLDTFLTKLGGLKVSCEVHDPLMRIIDSCFGVYKNTAIIEMALASGITLLDDSERDPLLTSTYGTGELILASLDKGVSKIIVGIGGSGTNDGGTGMASALGVKFLDENNNVLMTNGMCLNKIHSIDISNMDKRIYDVEIEVMCDVNNIFTGESGATYTYGPQKGADKKTLDILESGMVNLSTVIKRQFGIDLDTIEGSGAAGGLGGAFIAFCRGKLKSGIKSVLELTDFEGHIKTADYVITGEGKFDIQSLQGKVISGISSLIKGTSCHLIIVAGYSEIDNYENAFIISTTDRQYSERHLKIHAEKNLEKAMDVVIDYVRSRYE